MIGRILNERYLVEALIGTGGMAQVYKASTIPDHAPAAIKVLKEEYCGDPEFLRRFEREARAVLQLDHENLVQAYGVGTENGRPFIVMEYVDGQTLKDMIRESGPLDPEEAVYFACQILSALEAAHEAGIIHRDVKPQNVIVTPDGIAKLTDFGIARRAGTGTVTYAGSTVLGSVHYLSPEQAKGIPAVMESDIYSAGVTLYEMLCGQPPFTGDNSVAVALMHINEAPVPVSERAPAVSPALNDVVMKAMSKDPKDRYHSAASMRSDLLRALREPDRTFLRTASSEKASGWKKTRPKIYINWIYPITTAVLLSLAVLVVVFLQSRARYSDADAQLETVPSLIGKSGEDAEARARNYGFTLEIEGYETDPTVPYGYVLSQSPDTGAKAQQGSVVRVVLSMGTASPTMPLLTGKTPDEAKAELAALGLTVTFTKYMISNISIGYVCQQTPVAGTEINPRTQVTLYISSASTDSFSMPDLTTRSLSSALEMIAEYGFRNVLLRTIRDESLLDELIVRQSPDTGTFVLEETPVELTMNMLCTPDYAADVAFNVDIPENGTPVMVTIPEAQDGVAFERVLLETTLEKGEKVPVSLTARSTIPGSLEIRLYVGGILARTAEYIFAERLTTP